MRKIKFRAWDKEMEMMIYSDGRNKNDWQVHYDFVFGDNGLRCCWEEEYDDKFGYPATNNGELDNIMQYTGLRDKDGKEIYEKDIVKNIKTGKMYTIKFHGVFSGFIYDDTFFQHSHKSNWGELWLCSKYFEVVGNIYEKNT